MNPRPRRAARRWTALAALASLACVGGTAGAAEAGRSDWVRASEGGYAWRFQNDIIGDNEDRFLTAGAQITAALPERRFFDFSPLGAPGFVVLQIGARMYTPETLKARRPVLTERPYAAYAYVSAGMAAIRPGDILGREALVQDHLQLEFGASGPFLDFEELQNDTHEITGSQKGLGWANQIGDEAYVTLRGERMWRVFGRIGALETEIAPFLRLDLGTAENAATAGFEVAVGDALGRDLRLRESALGATSAAARARPDGWSWRAFAGGDLKLVATDATLDGGFFRDDQSIGKTLVRYRGRAGVELIYRGLSISYAVNLLGPEFEGQDEPQAIGAVAIGYQF